MFLLCSYMECPLAKVNPMPPARTTDSGARPPHGTQDTLGGFPPGSVAWRHSGGVPRAGDPIFFAVYPPPDLAPRIARLAWHLRDKGGLAGMPLGQARFHVSLLGLGFDGGLSPEGIKEIGDVVSTITMPPFRVTFDCAVSFIGKDKRPLVLRGDEGVTGLAMLRDQLVAALSKIDPAHSRKREFTPHLTLLYDRLAMREQAVEEISWTVSEFVLVRSVQGQSRHIPLARWRLAG
jgi:RNA 2',3'-cyclic 3'-phosphodiesterase